VRIQRSPRRSCVITPAQTKGPLPALTVGPRLRPPVEVRHRAVDAPAGAGCADRPDPERPAPGIGSPGGA
jgi:hypothetical protein